MYASDDERIERESAMTTKTSLTLEFAAPIGSELTPSGWHLPSQMTETQWKDAGALLAKIDQAKQWWLGDWWNKGVAWGDGKAACEEIGVEYGTAANCGRVCALFEFSRRRENLTFKHHAEVCVIDDEKTRDRFLDWCEKSDNEKLRSTRELREAIRDYLDEQAWTKDEKKRRDALKAGRTVVLNQKTDERLLRWAQFNDLLIRVDRSSDWGNPFEMPADGSRDQVCDCYEWYLQHKPSLLKKITQLKGKALACWCYPERCHGDHLARIANG